MTSVIRRDQDIDTQRRKKRVTNKPRSEASE